MSDELSAPVLPDTIDDYYEYRPSVGANAFCMFAFYLFAVSFAWRLATLLRLSPRVWTTLPMFLFALSEGGGYTARVLFAVDKGDYWNRFLAQLIILVIAPNLAQAYLYAVFSHTVLSAPIASNSRLIRHAKWLPHILIVSDLACLIVQSIGGAQLADKELTAAQQDAARTLMLAGLGAQLACLAVFLAVIWWFFTVCPRAVLKCVRAAIAGLTGMVALVVVRNCYRVTEFAGGSFTEGPLGRREWYYFLGDSVPMLLVCAISAVVPMEDPKMFEPLRKQQPMTTTNPAFDSGDLDGRSD